MTTGKAADFRSIADYLFSLTPRGTKLGIDRMRPLAAALGNPERAVPCIHVAGTNGKGSVAAMLDAILRAAGWRVGLYTSPHLVHVGERVQVNRQPLSEPQIISFTQELEQLSEKIVAASGPDDRPSFFELMTAMAFLHFQRSRCDVTVIEVGLGGEYDATNVVEPEVSIINSIGLDHVEWLGSTIEQIAKAKAGIIKRNVPVVIGRLPSAAEQVVREVAQSLAAPVFSVRETFGEEIESYPSTSLAGIYQRWNAATASLAARCLGPQWRLNEAVVERGLHAVDWRGRWERREIGGRIVILDASHNAEGAAVLERNLAELVAQYGRQPFVVVGALGADRAGPLIQAICRYAKELHLVVPAQPRATPFEEMESLVPSGYAGSVRRAIVREIFPGGDICTLGKPDDVIVVTGSIYLLGEVLTQLSAVSIPEN
ncbi:MAG: folylpolyglutamate synthase/dihydrofolate synthase family protein [Opitutus sp.]